MSQGHPHPAEMRAAVIAALVAGQSINKTAGQFGVSRKTVMEWRDAAGLDPNVNIVQPETREEIGQLVASVLRETLITLQFLAIQSRDPSWIKDQSAPELAVFYGVLADKSFRILEALQAGSGTIDHDPTPLLE